MMMMKAATDALALGQALAEKMAIKDWAGIEALLDAHVDFRGMTPGQFWEASDPGGVTEVFGQWFEDHDRIERLVSCEAEPISTHNHLTYRLEVHSERDEEDFVVEQQAYFEVNEGRISHLRMLCSGFLPRS